MRKETTVRVDPDVNEKLREIVAVRNSSGSFINKSKSIVADLINKAHKKECKK